MTRATRHIISIFAFLSMFTSGCSVVKDVKRELDVVDGLSIISGKVEKPANIDVSIVRVLLMKKGGDFDLTIINQSRIDNKGIYSFAVPPGEYFIVAYADRNNDEIYQDASEIAAYLGQSDGPPSVIQVQRQSSYEADTLVLAGILENTGEYEVDVKMQASKVRIGSVVELDDPVFSRRNALLGMVRPIEFVTSVGGGMFLFEPYDPSRIPVFFVHGIGGSVSNWEPMISALDNSQFQAIGVYYASGFRLNLISDFLLRGVNELQAKYKFSEFYVVAHSMGGLVSRSFLKKYTENVNAADLTFFATINSPMLGMNSANSGVKYSPIIIPSWRDVASGSDFIHDVMEWDLPADINYYLVFTHEPGEGSDGVVPLESQLPEKLQQEATKMYGFTGSHADILADAKFIERFGQMLNQHANR